MSYEITVYRSGAGQGTITFQGTTKSCWEDVSNLIPAKTYVGCQAAYMAKKGRKAVAIPNEQTGKNGIYIHEGYSPDWSEGCIVTDPDLVDRMWRTLYAGGKCLRQPSLYPEFGQTAFLSDQAGRERLRPREAGA